MDLKDVYKGKNVLVTGHTGFKGTWLCMILQMLGANVTGYALQPEKDAILFDCSKVAEYMTSIDGDIRDLDKLSSIFKEYRPEIVFHLAAQPIVRTSYKEPVYTYETNVMGTVNLLECARNSSSVKSVLNVTTDKVYKNREWSWGYRETDALDGYDPYSNSKSCSELVTHSYTKSFLAKKGIAVSTARAGNVIGGGDFATDRIIPDCIRAALRGEDIIIRNPYSIRPFQHVLEPLSAYLMIASQQIENIEKQGCYNVGPDESDCITVGEMADIFCDSWGDDIKWKNVYDGGPHEASFLKLDCSMIRNKIGWKPNWNIKKAVEKTIEWTKAYENYDDVVGCMKQQIHEFMQI